MNINEYRAAFAAYNSSLALARYRQHVGSKSELRIDRLRGDYEDLFSRGALSDLHSQLSGTWAEAETETAGLHGLLSAARLEHVEVQAAEVSRELAVCESAMGVEWAGETAFKETISYRLANEPTKVRRDQLAQRWSNAVGPCDDLRATRLQVLHETAGTLGFASYGDLIAESTRTDLNQVQRAGENLLKETEAVHRLALSRVVKGDLSLVPASDLNFGDLASLERLPWLAKFFATRNWSQTYEETMSLLGIRVDKQPNVRIEVGDTATSNCPSVCFPLNPPSEVCLVFPVRRTAFDFVCALYAMGVTQQHAWCSKILASAHPEFVYSADPATSQSYGYLFSFLLLDPKWIQEFLAPISEAQARELARDVAAVLALRVRGLAAEVSYAMLLHAAVQPAAEQLQSVFVDLQTRATGFRFSAKLFLQNLHERISSASHLRALAFAAGLREYLRGRYGNRWWASRKAGDELIDLWNTASRYPVEELARLNGFEVNFELITELLITNIRGAMK